ncbi:hypothetical protein FNV43_RR14587 [Rhamnella rubrinervis]|uniref:Uncharacterized protein n=1 Tax=Rhamnella rubrinervis TaxID=2594499 RepID=A0A8K0H3D2_9ROSA|nr:hypothetical protein FNV43_RR14587 [Rhamnella rubrinervis]
MELATVLKLLVMTIMVILLLLTSHCGAAAAHGTISSMEGNGTTTIDIILVSDQYADLGFRRPNPISLNTANPRFRYTCGVGRYPPCLGLRTNSRNGERCDVYKRDCHQAAR